MFGFAQVRSNFWPPASTVQPIYDILQLVPQLIINWRLKSVAHMPMKAMIYKTLSTVVDDFFAYRTIILPSAYLILP